MCTNNCLNSRYNQLLVLLIEEATVMPVGLENVNLYTASSPGIFAPGSFGSFDRYEILYSTLLEIYSDLIINRSIII